MKITERRFGPSRYLRTTSFDKGTYLDGSRWIHGTVDTKFGVVRIEGGQDISGKRPPFLWMSIILEGPKHTKEVTGMTLSERNAIIYARKFATEVGDSPD